MNIRELIVEAAQSICDFNCKLAYGRIGPSALQQPVSIDAITSQAGLVFEEKKEFETAHSVENLVKETIDLLVTEVWLEVLEAAYEDQEDCRSLEEGIQRILQSYRYERIKLQCMEPMLLLGRLGVDWVGAVREVLADNESKFATTVHECSKTVKHYKDVVGVECEARPVDDFHHQRGIFRSSDGKLLKPFEYMKKRVAGEGVDLSPFIPQHLLQCSIASVGSIQGATPTTEDVD